tara:strand:+ start:626 stop:1105 length:480 start_codon:yes stop_codon:yes gene_type:complete
MNDENFLKYLSKIEQDVFNKLDEDKQNNIIKSLNKNNISNNLKYIKEYLSSIEKTTLNKINSLSNKLSKQNIKDSNILNKSVLQLCRDWATTHNNIINDLIKLHSNMDDYNKHNSWWEYLLYYFKKIVNNILLKDDRLIYIGVSLILVTLLLYFIDISG